MTQTVERRTGGSKPVVVELIGPAGAGKSTVAHALSRCHPRVRTGFSLWGLPRRFLVASAPALMVPMLHAARHGSRLRGAELARMLRMGALRRVVQHAGSDRRLILLDEGPLFGLTWLDVFFGRNGDRGWSDWRRATLSEWAVLLDTVIWLDADDSVLADRIRTRAKPHPVKDRSDFEIRRFTTLFRHAFGRVIADLKTIRSVELLLVRSDRGSAENLAVRLRAVLQASHGR